MKPLIPFGWLPAAWGLKGQTREIAKAEYELEGYELDLRLAELKHAGDMLGLKKALLEIEANHGRIDDYEYDSRRIKLEHPEDSLELKLATQEVDYHHGKMTDNAYKKAIASLKGEPYIAVVDSTFDATKGIGGVQIEFDWNKEWIELLQEHKYAGVTEDQIVQQWYDDVCASVRNEMMQEPPPPMNGRRVVRPGPDGGPTEYY